MLGWIWEVKQREKSRIAPRFPTWTRGRTLVTFAEFGNTWAKWTSLLSCILGLRFLRRMQVDVSLETLVIISTTRRDVKIIHIICVFMSAAA